ncbi:MAG TPA: RNA methyltransferase [Candidatus Poseidoniaceae archaeon]|nr:RNA methyltransferase [Candidatus Poseidoniaceae archaeon]
MGERMDLPLPQGTFSLSIVLVGVSHPGNLGAICRTMLNYGFDDLRLVNPKCDKDDGETRARAKHAKRVLEHAETYDSIIEATHDCSLLLGTSGKREVGDKTLFRHFMYPWEMVERLDGTNFNAALIFGEEGKGLSTEDLASCDAFVTLPTWEGYPIANLSHAVNALLYEVQRHRVKTSQGVDEGLPDIVPLERHLSPALRSTLVDSIDQYSNALPGKDERKESVNQTLKRTLLRSTPTEDEATRIIGGLVDGTTALQYVEGDSKWMNQRRRKVD